MGIFVEQSRGGHDPAVETIAALRGLFVDEGLLNGMRGFWCSQTFERNDSLAKGARNGVETGSDGVIIDEHGAGTALSEAAAEPGIIESESVAKDVEKRALGIHVDEVDLAVHCYGSPGAH